MPGRWIQVCCPLVVLSASPCPQASGPAPIVSVAPNGNFGGFPLFFISCPHVCWCRACSERQLWNVSRRPVLPNPGSIVWVPLQVPLLLLCLRQSLRSSFPINQPPDWSCVVCAGSNFVLSSPWSAGKASNCPALVCTTEIGGLAACQAKCRSNGECNVLNFCPAGATCTSGTNRCCLRKCSSTSDLKLVTNWKGWDVYTRGIHIHEECNHTCTLYL